jgi:hypothetical protein
VFWPVGIGGGPVGIGGRGAGIVAYTMYSEKPGGLWPAPKKNIVPEVIDYQTTMPSVLSYFIKTSELIKSENFKSLNNSNSATKTVLRKASIST